ncbi:hypothetical protein OsI_38910 [Oryza sativa Indica Group]|uniref:Uncharacterized protein n=1 Tax=Oryza sativa subsp. indica TaxID=39946 RepID=A2ZM52_ORYSI|nr:hypothetical protein OsI_38910 [Oryza sativa Indica Group]
MVAALSSAWQDLPTDLLVLVLLRFPSLADRARLRTGDAISVSHCNQQKGIGVISSFTDRKKNSTMDVSDIAFFRGKLYTLSREQKGLLDVLELSMTKKMSSSRCYQYSVHHP